METPYTIPLLPLRDVVIFPHMVAPLFVGRERSIRALEEAMKNDKKILLCAQKDAKTNDPGPEDIYTIGTVGSIVRHTAPASIVFFKAMRCRATKICS